MVSSPRFAGFMPILILSQSERGHHPDDQFLGFEVYHLLEYTGNKAKVAAAIAKVVRKVPISGNGWGDEYGEAGMTSYGHRKCM